jgi:hypothetical protein
VTNRTGHMGYTSGGIARRVHPGVLRGDGVDSRDAPRRDWKPPAVYREPRMSLELQSFLPNPNLPYARGARREVVRTKIALWSPKWPSVGFTVANAGHGRSANARDWHGCSAVLTVISACGFEANLGLFV